MSDGVHKNNYFGFSITHSFIELNLFQIISVGGSDSFELYYGVAWAEYDKNFIFIVETVDHWRSKI